MAHADDFQHLDVRGCLTEAEWSAEGQRQFAATVTPKGQYYFTQVGGFPTLDNPVDVTLSPHGLLQVCLSRTKPFQHCEADQIRDLRATPFEAPGCRNRSLLIETLADALLLFEDRQLAMAADAQAIPRYMMRAWQVVGIAVDAYQYLRRHGKLSQPLPRPSPRGKTQQRAHQTVREAVQAVTADHYVQIAGLSPSRFRTELCRDMQAAFAPYGPSPQDFPAAAVHYALALILSRLHVEEGAEIDTIAARIRKRLDRV
jgi:hypothetical protein